MKKRGVKMPEAEVRRIKSVVLEYQAARADAARANARLKAAKAAHVALTREGLSPETRRLIGKEKTYKKIKVPTPPVAGEPVFKMQAVTNTGRVLPPEEERPRVTLTQEEVAALWQ